MRLRFLARPATVLATLVLELSSQISLAYIRARERSVMFVSVAFGKLVVQVVVNTLLVVKIGQTTFDNVIRAMQSLCENNVLGIVANGARASELYSKYTYYYSKAE